MNDYISRADAMGAVQDHFNANGFKGYDDGQKMMDRIKALPSADAVYGMWLPIEETLPTYDGGEKIWITGMKCSNCGKLLDLRVGYYYCPTCGARMKGGDE